MHPAFDQIAPLCGITPAPDVVAATAVTTAAVIVIIPKEATLAANAAGATPGGDLVPTTHHNSDHPDNTTADHDLAEDIDPTAEASLDPQEDIIATNPILQIVNAPGVP